MPRRHNGDVSFYAIIDQPLFGGGPDGFAIFARAMGAPGDRNLVGTYLDSGITYKNPSENPFDQTGDTIGFAAAYARIGSAARALAADTAAFTGQPYPPAIERDRARTHLSDPARTRVASATRSAVHH